MTTPPGVLASVLFTLRGRAAWPRVSLVSLLPQADRSAFASREGSLRVRGHVGHSPLLTDADQVHFPRWGK